MHRRLTRDRVVQEALRIGAGVAAKHAEEVDRQARFPVDTIDALREVGMLSAMISVEDGGAGCSISEMGRAIQTVGRYCASSALILAMHQVQVACLTAHGTGEYFSRLRKRVSNEQLLLASATTEKGIGGDVRTSSCTVTPAGAHRSTLAKNAPVISYGAYADAILVTARRDPHAGVGAQVLVVCERVDLTLKLAGTWDTVGLRGTCSPGFELTATFPTEQIFPESFAAISAVTMQPGAHVLWSHVWLGIAEAAAAKVRQHVRQTLQRLPPPNLAAVRAAELDLILNGFRDHVHQAAHRYDSGDRYVGGMSDAESTSYYNLLKVSASTSAVEVVAKAFLICGLDGVRLDSPLCLDRHMRDAYVGQLMINNDRILQNTALLISV